MTTAGSWPGGAEAARSRGIFPALQSFAAVRGPVLWVCFGFVFLKLFFEV